MNLLFQQLHQRITFDLSHIKVYSLLFGEIPSFMTSPQSTVCLQEGVRLTGRLTSGMEMAVSVAVTLSQPLLHKNVKLAA